MDGILEIVATSSFVGMLVGGLITHNLTLGRDKRKEYNDAVRPLKAHISEARRSSLKNPLTLDMIVAVEHFVSPKLYDRLMSLFKDYQLNLNIATSSNDWGVPVMTEEGTVAVSKTLDEMDKLLKVK
ncbi:hypothetical protein LG819_004731 [Vibrio parahaemolyticus]|uniref:hypothetical protein n=1 Tax=Vibrio parahaemolyticus TaxID=670 RepID=UPI000B799681|nr:hypothetical protein [Vibrio parahaemolyticus]EGR9044515.1 hypothetical protein [Vibrio parahaemolyticus]EII3081047.1 hypothetical protein [Vibrio parahaemolyticus]MCX8853501.1 hypothetical protein [Vibrio parahaemolyticus]OXD92540.1 hypothetical protein CE132_11050 [Vibrio parahaemolyticus]TOF39579.1 hypothetical protein CGJ28_19815 [Vibrio parahaemolyticus]